MTRRLSFHEMIDELADCVIEPGFTGFTYNVAKREFVKSSDFECYVVASRKDREKRHWFPNGLKRVTVRLVLESYILFYEFVFAKSKNYLGVWMDNDEMVLDVVQLVGNLDDALELAKSAKQDAVYDLKRGKVVMVNEVIA